MQNINLENSRRMKKKFISKNKKETFYKISVLTKKATWKKKPLVSRTHAIVFSISV